MTHEDTIEAIHQVMLSDLSHAHQLAMIWILVVPGAAERFLETQTTTKPELTSGQLAREALKRTCSNCHEKFDSITGYYSWCPACREEEKSREGSTE